MVIDYCCWLYYIRTYGKTLALFLWLNMMLTEKSDTFSVPNPAQVGLKSLNYIEYFKYMYGFKTVYFDANFPFLLEFLQK